MRALRIVVLAICSIWLSSEPAFAVKRVALVMGNSAYQHVGRLTNPTNDAAAMSATLKSAGFDVVQLRRDLKASEMRRALRDFSDNVRGADMAVVYFAGHGVEIDGINYLIPVDAVLERDIDAFDEAVPLERILTVIDAAKQLRLVILDACRDNPFDKTMKRTLASRAIGRGLAKVEPSSPNTLIAFAARAGSTAIEGDGPNSPFTAALIKYLPRPGLDLRKAFGYARDEVVNVTSNRQEPFIYGSLGGDDVPLVPAVAAPPPPPDPGVAVRRDYELAERLGTRPVWDSFIKNHPVGFYTDLAKAQRAKLDAETKAAEEARAAAERKKTLEAAEAAEAERAKAATQVKSAEDARIAAEKAKALEADRAKAAAQAKAAEDARIAADKARAAAEAKAAEQRAAAEKKKALEEAKAAEADRAKAALQAKAAEDARLAAEKAKAEGEAKAAEQRAAADKKRALEEAKAAEVERARLAAQAKAAADNSRDEEPVGQQAALTPPEQSAEMAAKSDKPAAADIPRLLQTELRRVGCNTGAIDGDWNAAAQKSLGLFNRNAGTRLDVKVASLDALEIVRGRTARVCPVICEHGYKPDGDGCSKITCRAGYELDDDDTCRKVGPKKPVVKREQTPKPETERTAVAPASPLEPRSSGGGGGCVTTSCSAARAACARRHAASGRGDNYCSMEYGRCMQNGAFIGHACRQTGLSRN